jgi:hypothetical protein
VADPSWQTESEKCMRSFAKTRTQPFRRFAVCSKRWAGEGWPRGCAELQVTWRTDPGSCTACVDWQGGAVLTASKTVVYYHAFTLSFLLLGADDSLTDLLLRYTLIVAVTRVFMTAGS